MRQLQLFNDLILTPRADQQEAQELLNKLMKKGPVFGTDEAGRGALAGPVIAASVYLTKSQEEKLISLKLRDSKKMTPKSREKLFAAMLDMKILWSVSSGSISRIENDNILMASLWTMGKSVSKLAKKIKKNPVCVIVDGTERIPELNLPQWTLIQADNLIPAVSAASVIAKVIRDRIMTKYAKKFPIYDFDKNKGYPTQYHMDMVAQNGMCRIHRPYFCKKIINSRGK